MRILLINDNHQISGGAENYFFNLKQRLKNVPTLEVYSLGFGDEPASGEDFYILPALKSKAAKLLWQILPQPFMYLKLRNILQTLRPDVIHLHNVKQYTASMLRALKPYPVVHTVHDYSLICPTAQNIHQDAEPCPTGLRPACFWQHQVKFNRLVYFALTYSFHRRKKQLRSVVGKYFAPSPLLLDYLEKNAFTNAEYIAPFKPDVQTYSFANLDPNHFLFAGSLGQHKGVKILIEEFALAYAQNNQLSLTIAGSGIEEKQLRARVSALHLSKQINFIGWQESLEQEYARAAAVIFPSIGFETFGLVIAEAMSHARPVIGSNRGAPPWLIEHEQSGFIFNPVQSGDLAAKMLAIAGNLPLIEKLGSRGYAKIHALIDNDNVLNQIIASYRAVSLNFKRNIAQ